MKREYVIYKDMPLVAGKPYRVYLKEDGTYTTTKEMGRKYTINRIIEIVLIVLQLILKFRTNLKYEKL